MLRLQGEDAPGIAAQRETVNKLRAAEVTKEETSKEPLSQQLAKAERKMKAMTWISRLPEYKEVEIAAPEIVLQVELNEGINDKIHWKKDGQVMQNIMQFTIFKHPAEFVESLKKNPEDLLSQSHLQRLLTIF